MFLTEHSQIPASRESPCVLGGELPEEYLHILDPSVALTTIAAATSTLEAGTGGCLVVERDPITLAKQVATLDLVSGGRFLFGMGAGWNLEQMRDHGTDSTRPPWETVRIKRGSSEEATTGRLAGRVESDRAAPRTLCGRRRDAWAASRRRTRGPAGSTRSTNRTICGRESR